MKESENETKNLKKDDDYKTKTEKNKLLENKNPEETKLISTTDTQANIYGRDQQITVCQFCKSKIFTNVEQQVSWFGIFICLLLLVTLRFFAIILIILIIPLTQSTIHTCPNCLNRIGVHTFYDTISLKDKIFTFQFLGFGVIITKKQLLGTFFFILFGIIIYSIVSNISFTKTILKESWYEYQTMCNEDFGKCKRYFLYQDVYWTGNIIRVNFNENFFSRYRAFILMKMDKNNDQDYTDMVLDVTDAIYKKYKIDIMDLRRGDEIAFNCTLRTVISQESNKPIRADLVKFYKTGNKIKINAHIHRTGRYATHTDKVSQGKQVYSELPDVVSSEDKNIKQKETVH